MLTDQKAAGRRRRELVELLIAVAVLLLTAIVIDARSVSELETDAFRLVNGLPGLVYAPVWLVMQLGNFLVVPVVVIAALLVRKFRLAIALALSGTLVWLLAKLIKQIVERGRPGELLDDIVLRHAPAAGNGYISGHAAVAVALATVAAPYLSPRWRLVCWILAGLVCLARVYVGAHLPLDVLGGAAFGWGVGLLVNLLVVAPPRNGSASL